MPAGERERAVFTDIPSALDKYFEDREVVIHVVPSELIQGLDRRCQDFRVTCAKQYRDYLNNELTFWTANDPKRIFNQFSDVDRLQNAIRAFDNAANYVRNNSSYNVTQEMNNSVRYVRETWLCSKTTLAKFLIDKCNDKTSGYINGFRSGLLRNRSNSAPTTIDGVEGFYSALVFSKCFSEIVKFSKDSILRLNESFNNANDNFGELNRQYADSFHSHENMIMQLTQKTDDHMAQMSDTATLFWAECEKRRSELETLYNEKLKLEGPAQYWAEMENEYKKKASFWVWMSLIVTVVTIVGLTALWLAKPDLFSNDSHWMDVFRNSAIITIMVSLAVYILRLFVKLAISSFHLSRDAKERNKLSYFYLALTAKGVVDEKERSIVLNALFSRADTGLLKGDSAPTMPTSVTEIVNKLNN